MSANLPHEIQAEIFNRLPVKLLVQFRSVSKAWKSLIDGSDFIKHYSSQHQHLLVKYCDSVDFKPKYVSYVDDHTFPHHNVSLAIPLLVKMLNYPNIIGSSRGLLCLYGDRKEGRNGHISGTGKAVFWNPSIRKAVAVSVPNMTDNDIYGTVLGFGVCGESNDPKIVKITYINRWTDIESIRCIPCQVEIFTLSTGAWRSLYHINLPRKSIRFSWLKVVVDVLVYWLATERINMDGRWKDHNMIISFDMTIEDFGEVNLPDSLAHADHLLYISNLRNSLVVLDRDEEANKLVFHLWMMEDGDPKSLTKLFIVNFNTPNELVRGFRRFRKTGEPIFEIEEGQAGITGALGVYEPHGKYINILGINGIGSTFYTYPYMETLLLLDQPNIII